MNADISREEFEELQRELNEFKEKTRRILTEILKLMDRSEDLLDSYGGTPITVMDLARQIREL